SEMEEETRMRVAAKIRNIAFIRKVLFGMWMKFHCVWSSICSTKIIKRGGKKPEEITENAVGNIPQIERLSPLRVCRRGDSPNCYQRNNLLRSRASQCGKCLRINAFSSSSNSL